MDAANLLKPALARGELHCMLMVILIMLIVIVNNLISSNVN